MPFSNRRRGVSIRMFLADGTPEGLRLVEKSNWNGLAVMCSRAQYPEVRGRDEFSRPGVYLLTGPASDGSGRQTIYIGQADIARERLDQHQRNRDSWSSLILFVSRDTTLNKAHVQYLESRLIELATRARRVDIENGNAPRTPFLSEADRADADAFLDDMLIIYPVLGVRAFEVTSDVVERAAHAPTQAQSEVLHLSVRGTQATGQDTPEGFIVFAGARARPDAVPSFQGGYRELRDKLLETGVFEARDNMWVLMQDYRFDAPSHAAGVLAGRGVNGREAWRDAQGRTLKQLQELALERLS